MNSSLVDIAYSQKDIASSQKQNHSEMISILKKIGNSGKNRTASITKTIF